MKITREIAKQIHAEVLKGQDLAGQGEFSKAEDVLKTALKLCPEHPDPHQVLGLIHFQQKKFEAAKLHLKASIKAAPEQPFVLASLGQVLMALKDNAGAILAFQDAVILMPDLGAAWGFLSELLSIKDLPDLAGKIHTAFQEVENLSHATRIQLGYALTTCLEKLGQKQSAADTRQYFTYMQTIAKQGGNLVLVSPPPEDVKASLLRAQGNLAQANYRRVEKISLGILEKDPDQVDALILMGLTKSHLNDYDTAVELLSKSLALAPAQPKIWIKLGQAYNNIREFYRSEHCYKMAILYDPTAAEAFYLLGSSALGRGEEALAKNYINRTIAIRPGYSQPYDLLRRIKDYQPDEKFFQALEKNALDVKESRNDATFANYILAAHYAKTKDNEKFIQHVSQANLLQKEGAPIGIDKNIELLRASKDVFKSNLVKNQAGEKSKLITPVFIVGLFRSGSTLIEQILSSHTQVFAGDEIHFLHTHLMAEVEKSSGSPYPQGIDKITSKVWGEIGLIYQKRLSQIAPKAPFITDKLLTNAFYVGLIRLAMPWAKVIHINRNPVDRALSIYSNYFNEAVTYAFDLRNMARNTKLTKAAINFWQEQFPGFILDVEYEDLVADMEGQTRKILDFCGLDWDPACLEFYKSDRTVLTISVGQVHKPIYTSSIGKWKQYADLLEPFRTEMGDMIDDDGFLVPKG